MPTEVKVVPNASAHQRTKAAPTQNPETDNFFSRLKTKATDTTTHGTVVEDYVNFYGDHESNNHINNHSDVKNRKENAQTLTNCFYDMVTDFYEYAWGQSFHFCKYYKGENFATNIARHEDNLALKLQLKPGEKCLDVGCGVGGPMREIAKFSGATVVGLNNNEYQVARNQILSERLELGNLCHVVKGDFHHMPFQDNYFDKAYAVEATCHAQKLEDPYAEIYRTLKPGGYFACYEWLTTDKYDENNPEHKSIMLGLEEGNSCPKLASIPQCLEQLRKVGFEVVEHEDLAADTRSCLPWYFPLDGFYDTNPLNFYFMWAMKPFGRSFTRRLVSVLELLRIAPKGTCKVADVLNLGADNLVLAGKEEIFTPMFYFLARKPLNKD